MLFLGGLGKFQGRDCIVVSDNNAHSMSCGRYNNMSPIFDGVKINGKRKTIRVSYSVC